MLAIRGTTTKELKKMKTCKLAIVGIGNCASSLVQLIHSANESPDNFLGIMHQSIGGYHAKDIQLVAAFDINQKKIGSDLADAIFSTPNCTTQYFTVPKTGVLVSAGAFVDGIGSNLLETIEISPVCYQRTAKDIAAELLQCGAEAVVNYLPVGARHDTNTYATASLLAKCAFVNCNPELLASDPVWAEQFRAAGLPILGDDIKSQLGATMLHRTICQTLLERGAHVARTYQLNVGGNTDFQNMVDRSRSKSKKHTKTDAIVDILGPQVEINVGPSDHLPLLKDRKVAYIRLEGSACLGMQFSIEIRLDVEDSPNSAGVAIDAIRCAKYAKDQGMAGEIKPPAAFLFKHPPQRYPERDEKLQMEQWISLR
jgi:myo-inositol-1-phosphate synthase